MNIAINNIKIKLKAMYEDKIARIDDLLLFCTENNCSDLYIKIDESPYISRYGSIYRVPSLPTNTLIWNEWAKEAITSEMNANYVRNKMLDMPYEIDVPETSINFAKYESYRYRVSVGFSTNKNIATFRMITPDLPSFDKINFPVEGINIMREGFKSRNGIIMVCGPTGSGKTTTMSACINDFSSKKGEPLDNNVIITLENPIEYVFKCTDSTKIMQKELGKDFKTFPDGVKQALREHPNTIFCGELRDKEGINTCIEAARTGHKVMTTFHTENVAGSIARMYNYIAGGNSDIIYDLISNLSLMICQRLTSSSNEFILTTQYMLFNEEIKKYIITAISENKNVSLVVNDMFKNESLLKAGLVKDWG